MQRRRLHSALNAVWVLTLCSAFASAQPPGGRGGAAGRGQAPPPFQFQMMGPSFGGRVASITGVPGDVRIWYLGSASGGVWKSVDDGNTFAPVFDKMTAQAIGAIAVAPSDPNIVWAGTGEAWAIRDADVMGDGIYKSTDAGATWTNMGLPESGRIGRIIVHPTNPNVVYVCVLGRATGPQQERGVYRTTDGGRTWTRSLFVDGNTGCSGLTLDAKDANTLFAGMWQVEMHTYAMYSGGTSSAIYVTHDAGVNWTRVEHPGLPKSPLGKIDVAIAPSDSRRVYALIQTAGQGSVWRSDDGGTSWKVVNWQRTLIGRAGYYIRILVSPTDPNEVLIANSSFFRSTDGGLNFATVPWGGDNHDIWWDPKNADHFGLTDDAGARVTTNHGRSFLSIGIPNGQMYHVSVDQQVPYWILTNRQDNGTMRGPSTAPEAPPTTGGRAVFANAGGGRGAGAIADTTGGRGGRGAGAVTDTTGGRGGRGAGAPADTIGGGGAGGGGGGGFGGGGRGGGFSTWDRGLGGCESGFTLADPTDPNIIWSSCYGSTVTRYDHRTKRARSVSPYIHTLDSPPNEAKYRCHWTPPLAIDPFDHNTVYFGCQLIFKTSNGGQSWTEMSPDLSTKDPSRIVSSGGIVPDNLGQFYGEVVFAIAPSEIQRGLIWAGTNDGKVWYTKDGGKSWNDVTKNIAGMPVWGTIRKIEPSHFDAGTAYIAVDYHMMDNREPFIYKTTDFGQTWKKISDGLPAKHPLAYVLSVAENPNRKGMIFAGTGNAFYYSIDDGAKWTQFKEGLPAAPVSWIVVPKLFHDVVVSTYGRGIFILRDITTLEQQDAVVADADLHLFAPRPGVREARNGSMAITYSLKAVPKDSVKIEIVDAKGATIRTMKTIGREGMNLVTWDLRYDPPLRVDLRAVAPDNPHIWDDPRFKGQTRRPIVHWGIQGAMAAGPLALSGKYSARLTVDGKTQTQGFDVIKTPEITTSDADLLASLTAQMKIRDDMTASAEMVNRIEVIRRQIEDRLKGDTVRAELKAALAELEKKMVQVELMILTREDLNSDDKYYTEPFGVYLNLIWLNGEVGTGAGDVAGGAEFRPTEGSMQVLGLLEKELAAAKAAYKTLMDKESATISQLTPAKPSVVP
jgi:photosystem II stability/assembly factor-like uncharacterized protein